MRRGVKAIEGLVWSWEKTIALVLLDALRLTLVCFSLQSSERAKFELSGQVIFFLCPETKKISF